MNSSKCNGNIKTKFSFGRLSCLVLTGAFVAFIIFSFSSCARKITFLTSSVVPAATGQVKVKKDKNNNYNINVDIRNLAQPSQLQPPKQTYVVWMESAQNMSKNIGQINTSSGFLSSKLKASFQTVSSFKPEKIFITAEDEANVQYPTGARVLTTTNF
ncbi:MAG: hypothetical protein ABIN04_14260 [Ginsengibacter sp.]